MSAVMRAAVNVPPPAAAGSISLRPLLGGDATHGSSSSNSRRHQAPARVLSTSADAGDATTEDASAGAEGEGAAGGDSQEGGAGDSESTPPLEENPLEGLVADDGDPGPPPPLDPSIVTEPSPKVRLFFCP